MALVGKIFEEEKDILYFRGEYKCEARGERFYICPINLNYEPKP